MAYAVQIAGTIATVVAGSLIVDNTIGKRSTASFQVHSSTSTHYQQYQQVLILDQFGALTFFGYVATVKEQKPGFQSSLLHTITCCDQHFLADKRVVAASYTNKTCGFIVQDIVTNILSAEGVSVGQIYDGQTPSIFLYPSTTLYPGGNVGLIPQANFFYCTVAQALDELAKEASSAGVPYYWVIDYNKQIWFVPYTSITNSNTIDGTTIDQAQNPPYVERQNPAYRNTQYILGGMAQTVQQTEDRQGDGNTQSWAMGYQLASAPTITVNGSGQTVGLKGTSGSQFYWAQGDATITQDSGQTKLTSSQTLQVVYIGQYPSVIFSQNNAQISYQAGIDFTTGIVEEVETDNTLTSTANGLSEASQLLTRYAAQGTQLTCTTRTTGYAPGQLVTVNLPMHGLYNAQMLITEVSASDQTDNYNIWYTIKAVLGPYDVTWVDFFAGLLKQSAPANSINIGATQSTSLLASFTDSLSASAVLNVNIYACPIPNTTLHPSTTLYAC